MFGSLLTTVSGFFNRSLILGTFLPALIFTYLMVLFAAPLVPLSFDLSIGLNIFGGEWKLLSLAFVAIVLSGVLYNLNDPLIRLYEGYPWMQTRFGKWSANNQKKKYRELEARVNGIRTLLRAMGKADEDLKKEDADKSIKKAVGDQIENYSADKQWLNEKLGVEEFKKSLGGVKSLTPSARWDFWNSAIVSKWTESMQKLKSEFPNKEDLVLPTRLGNVIRSFEDYPRREYEIDAIALYPRLIAKIDKDYGVIIDEAKTSFDFMINSSFLGVVAGAALLVTGVWFARPFIDSGRMIMWLTGIVLSVGISVAAYHGAISRAQVWGESVKSAFDLYRNSMLQQLGFSEIPTTRNEERELWSKISRQILYGDHPLLGPNTTSYARPKINAVGSPAEITLDIFRGIEPLADAGKYKVVVTITNPDKSKTCKNIVLTEHLPEGAAYRPESAVLKNRDTIGSIESAYITGVNPYEFEIGSIKPGLVKTLTYEIVSIVSDERK